MTLAPSKREFDIDFFRGWVCLSLMILHFYNSQLYDAYNRLFGDTGVYLIWNWRLGVESFFVLAGFMMAHMFRPVPGEDVSVGGYLKRRFYRLIIPYWAAVIIYFAYRWAARLVLHAENAPTPTELLAQLFLMQDFFVAPERLERVIPAGYWSMVALEQFYLLWLGVYAICLFVFVQIGGDKANRYTRVQNVMAFLTLAAALGSLALNIWAEVDFGFAGWHMMTVEGHTMFVAALGGWSSPLSLPQFVVYLGLGMLLYWSIRQKAYRPHFWLLMTVLLVCAIATGQSRLWKGLVAAAIFLPLARGVRAPNNMILRGLAYLGKRSYSLYLIHSIAGIAFISVTWKLTNKSDWFALPITLGAVVVSIAVAIVFYHAIEVPCQRKARSVEYRRKRAATGEATVISAAEPAMI